jgi:hypothetical protein
MHQVRRTGLVHARRRVSFVLQVAFEIFPKGLLLKNSHAAFFECFLLNGLGLLWSHPVQRPSDRGTKNIAVPPASVGVRRH